MFYARLDQLCKEAGTSVAAVAEDVLHVSSGAPTFWKKGASPKASIVAVAARHFGVSADYLLGLTTEKRALSGARALDEEESRLVDALRAATEPVRKAALGMAFSALETHARAPKNPRRPRRPGGRRSARSRPRRPGRITPNAPTKAWKAGPRRVRPSPRRRRTSAAFWFRSSTPASST